MNMTYLAPGLLVAAVGFAVLFSLLGSVGALAKSKQIGALRAIAAGDAGSGKRKLLFFALSAMALGTCGVFGGVAKSDGERAAACQHACETRRYALGRIGPAAKPTKGRPGPACLCSGGENAGVPFEMPADDLSF